MARRRRFRRRTSRGVRRGTRRSRRRGRQRRRRIAGARKRVGRGLFKNWGKISALLGGLAFFQQLTEKDMQGTANMPIADKAKVFINTVTGRLLGIGVVPGMAHPPQTFNFAGIFNKWTGLGAGLFLYGKVAPMGPHRGKAGTLGKALLTGGILGGFFDAPSTQGTTATAQSFSFHNVQSQTVPMNSLTVATRSTLR